VYAVTGRSPHTCWNMAKVASFCPSTGHASLNGKIDVRGERFGKQRTSSNGGRWCGGCRRILEEYKRRLAKRAPLLLLENLNMRLQNPIGQRVARAFGQAAVLHEVLHRLLNGREVARGKCSAGVVQCYSDGFTVERYDVTAGRRLGT
jgi:hypothetical protein